MIPNIPSVTPGPCSSCGTPPHSGSDDANNTRLKSIEATNHTDSAEPSNKRKFSDISDSVDNSEFSNKRRKISGMTDDIDSSEFSNKRKFSADNESSTQRHPDYQDSRGIISDGTDMPGYGWGEDDC